MNKIQPGVYQANIINYGIDVNKNGNAQAAILFEYNDHDGQRHEVTWFGSFKEGKALEITLKTLLACGFSKDDPAELAAGYDSHALDVSTPVKITIEEQEYEGKKFMRVQWVNPLRQFKSMSKDEAKVKLGAMNLKAQLALMKQELGQPVRQEKPMREHGDDSDDLNW